MAVVKVSSAQFAAVGAGARDRFVTQLMDDLARRYPERFGLVEPAALRHHVEHRLAYAQHFGLTRQDAVAALLHRECAAGVDFTQGRPGDWWHDILTADVEQEHKMRMLEATAGHLEVDPRFVPVFD